MRAGAPITPHKGERQSLRSAPLQGRRPSEQEGIQGTMVASGRPGEAAPQRNVHGAPEDEQEFTRQGK